VNPIQEEHSLTLTKLAERQLREDVIQKNIERLVSSVNNRSLEIAGWRVKESPIGTGSNGYNTPKPWQQFMTSEGAANWRYEMYLTVQYTRDDKPADMNVFHSVCRTVFTRSAQPNTGRWTLTSVDDKEYIAPDENNIPLSGDFIGYTEVDIPDDFETYIKHLYGLDPHFARTRRAMEAGIQSNWINRYHCAYIGPPGCGKSDMCQSIKRALGDEACLEFDATATTAAGAIKELAEREILPRILIVEEIEKSDEKALSFLLAVLDLRAEIRKTTARATIQRDTKLFCIATVNNYELFSKLQAGALASRFANQIWFRRPTREQLQMILHREVTKVQGDYAWIDPTLDYCEKEGITDPRRVTALCLCGREMLITGEYQKMLEETQRELMISEDWT
jgi:hypothetical protein